MGSLQDAVMQYVEGELKKDPRVKNVSLFAAAREIDESVGELTLQQFHAKYRLPAIRTLAPQGRPARKPKAVSTPDPSPASLGDGAAVMEYVERTLEANPGIANADLFAGAREIDPSVGQLTGRQFHARFPLQVKARLARAAAPEAKTPPEPEVPTAEETAAADAPPVETGDPVAVRRLLLDLAKELASAESKAEVIELMARLDEYVAEIMKAARG
ncbi:MAG: hypothetical protein OXH49_15845 [Gemmatimonadetes bacterium]|nr:hypothetical protein [Gemmatimonadota bacterium]